MKPRISLLTLGVNDLEHALAFRGDGLGLPTKGVVGTECEHGAVADAVMVQAARYLTSSSTPKWPMPDR